MGTAKRCDLDVLESFAEQSTKHCNGEDVMKTDEMIDLCKSILYIWTASGGVEPMPIRDGGIFIYEPSGKRYYDFNSQLMSVNIGHSHPKVIAARSAADKADLHLSATATEPRARLSKKLAELVPVTSILSSTRWVEPRPMKMPSKRFACIVVDLRFSVVIAAITVQPTRRCS